MGWRGGSLGRGADGADGGRVSEVVSGAGEPFNLNGGLQE
jgi:hypothetical protein